MKTTLFWTVALVGLAVATAVLPAQAAVFLTENFDYETVAAMETAGWSMIDTAAVVDTHAKWTLMVGDQSAYPNYNPPTINGTPGVGGKFIISEASGSYMNRDFENAPKDPVDSGASHDLYAPAFSTTGQSNVWLHADVNAILNNEGEAIFDIDVSTDGGTTWANAFRRICPDRGQPGHFDPLPTPVTTLLPNNSNADGFHGRLDLNLSSYAADAASVKVRFRHYEPYHDLWVKMDNLLIDNVPTVHGSTTVFEEKFDHPTGEPVTWLGEMTTDGMYEDELTWVTWGTGGVQNGESTTADFGWYVPVQYYDPVTYLTWRTLGGQTRQVNRLEHGYLPGGALDPAGINPNPDFAIIDCNYNSANSETANEYMMTPLLDLTDLTEVFLGYQDETWWYTKDEGNTCTKEVLLMRDDDANGPDRDDEVVKLIFTYDQDSMGTEDPISGEDTWYAERLFSVPEAAGSDDMFFAWHYESLDSPWWAIDSIKISGNSVQIPGDANGDGVVDDDDATILASHWQVASGAVWADGDFNGDGKVNDKDASILASHWHAGMEASAPNSAPEPSTLALLLGAAAMAFIGYRRRR